MQKKTSYNDEIVYCIEQNPKEKNCENATACNKHAVSLSLNGTCDFHQGEVPVQTTKYVITQSRKCYNRILKC